LLTVKGVRQKIFRPRMNAWESDAMFLFARESQIAAGAFIESADPTEILTAVHAVLAVLPDPMGPAAVPIIAAVLAALARHVLDHSPQRPSTCSQAHRALAVLLALHSRPALTLDTVAERLNVSVAYLSASIKSRTGRGFLDHLHALRVLHAVLLLQESSATIGEIAARCGYRRTSHLDKHFHTRLHMSPMRFRRLMRCSSERVRKRCVPCRRES
jgi:AraC-like DNA-binding protein